MKHFKLKTFLIILLWIIPPLIFSIWHIKEIGIAGHRPVQITDFNQISINKDIPNNSSTSLDYVLKNDPDRTSMLEDATRYFSLIQMPNILRYNIFVQQSVSAKISYLENLNGPLVQSWFNATLACSGKEVSTQKNLTIIKTNLKLTGENNNENELNNITKDCIITPVLAFKNDSKQSLYNPNIEEFSPDSKINILIKPNTSSIVFIFIGWYILWFGLLTLLRDGPYKTVRNTLIKNN